MYSRRSYRRPSRSWPRYTRRYQGGGSQRRASGNMRAARAQRDTGTFVLRNVRDVTVTLPASEAEPWAGVFLSHWAELCMSPFFENYRAMYDQVRLDRATVKITGATNNLSTSGSLSSAFSSPQVLLAIDRNGVDQAAGYQFSIPEGGASVQYTLSADASRNVSTYSSCRLYSWSSGNAFHAYQTIYPSTIQEKSQYISLSDLPWTFTPEQQQNSLSPASPVSNPACPWKPTTLLAVRTPVRNTADETTFTFTVELSYVVTFRGLRKAALSYPPLTDTIDHNGVFEYTAGPYGSARINVGVDTGPVYRRTITGNCRVVEIGPFSAVDFTVNVPPYATEAFERTITENGPVSADGPYSSVSLNVNVPPYATEAFERTITENGPVSADGPYSSVSLNVQVEPVINLVGIRSSSMDAPVPFTEFLNPSLAPPGVSTGPTLLLYFEIDGPDVGSTSGRVIFTLISLPQTGVAYDVPPGAFYCIVPYTDRVEIYDGRSRGCLQLVDDMNDASASRLALFSPPFRIQNVTDW